MIDIRINGNKVAELGAKGYDLHIIALLQLLSNGESVPHQSLFIKAEAKSLRKGLISDGYLTKTGKELLEFLKSPDEVKFEKNKMDDNSFNRWWETYPRSNHFTYKGRIFQGERGLRVKKDDCRIKLNTILDEGVYSIDDMVRALEFEVKQKIEKSYKEGKNILSFMSNSLSYLNQRIFENFVEISKNQEKKEIFTGTDI